MRNNGNSTVSYVSIHRFMPIDQSPLRPEEWAKTSTGARSLMKASHKKSGETSTSDKSSDSKPKPKLTPHHAHSIPLGQHMRLMRGHTRPFKVLAIPSDMQLNGRGPLLSAFKYDRDMLWARASQLFEVMVRRL